MIRYSFIISNWSTTDGTVGPCSSESGRKTICGIQTATWKYPFGGTGAYPSSGTIEWKIRTRDNPTYGNMLEDLQRAGFYVPYRTSILIPASVDVSQACAGLAYYTIGPSSGGVVQPFPYPNPPCLRLASLQLPELSCETPDVQVEMGEHFTRDFANYGDTSLPKAFSIKMNKCSNGLSTVKYSLSANPTAPAVNATQGIVSLNKNSTAQGISLQVLDNNLQPIQLNKEYTFTPPTNTGGSFSIPMNARYIRTLPNGGSSPVTAGTANSEVAFVMSYL